MLPEKLSQCWYMSNSLTAWLLGYSNQVQEGMTTGATQNSQEDDQGHNLPVQPDMDWAGRITANCAEIWSQLGGQRNMANDIRAKVWESLGAIKDAVISKQAAEIRTMGELVNKVVDTINKVQPYRGDAAGRRGPWDRGEGTYKEVLLRPKVRSRDCKLVLKPKETQTAETTKRMVEEKVVPEKLRVVIRDMRVKKDGTAIITMDSKESRDTVREAIAPTMPEFHLGETRRARARIVVGRVDKSISVEKTVGKICAQNPELDALVKSSEEDAIRMIRDFRSNYNDRDVLIETSANVASAMSAKGYVGIDYKICRVRPYVVLDYCFNCGKYGHIDAGGKCKEKMRCARCGDHDHKTKECMVRGDGLQCLTCTEMGVSREAATHEAMSIRCPVRKERLLAIQRRIVEGWDRESDTRKNGC